VTSQFYLHYAKEGEEEEEDDEKKKKRIIRRNFSFVRTAELI
jgi:hypothetical protein